jgi:hypothetical protein
MEDFIGKLVPRYLSPKEAIQASFVETIRELRNHSITFRECGFPEEAQKVRDVVNKIEIPEDFTDSWQKYINIITGMHRNKLKKE